MLLAAAASLLAGCYPGGRSDPWAVNLRYSLGDGEIDGPAVIDLAALGDLTSRVAVIEVTNAGRDAHDLRFVALDPGETAEWAAAQLDDRARGELPSPWGGTATLAAGQAELLRMRIDNGRYALLCLQRDADGASHSAHGEVREVRTG